MRATLSHRQSFNSSHKASDQESEFVCGRNLHGHDWFAEIRVVGDPMTSGGIESTGPESLSTLLVEIDGRHLNDMLPAVHPTCAGVAGWILERMRMDTPGLVSVTVGFTNHAVTVEV